MLAASALEPAVQIGGIEVARSAIAASILSVVTGRHRATVNGPSSTTTGTSRPLDTVRRASSAMRANQAIESDRYSPSGRSDNQTAVPIASSWTEDACSVGWPSRAMLIRPIAPYDAGLSCQPVRRPSSPSTRNPP